MMLFFASAQADVSFSNTANYAADPSGITINPSLFVSKKPLYGNFKGIDKDVNAWKAAKAANQAITAKKTDPQVGFSSSGREFRGTGFKLVDGQFQGSGGKGLTGTYDFVVTQEGVLKLGHGHYYLSESAPTVQAAGTISLYNGMIKNVTNNSGHYKPNAQETGRFSSIFKKLGIDLPDRKLKTIKHD